MSVALSHCNTRCFVMEHVNKQSKMASRPAGEDAPEPHFLDIYLEFGIFPSAHRRKFRENFQYTHGFFSSGEKGAIIFYKFHSDVKSREVVFPCICDRNGWGCKDQITSYTG